MTLYYVRVKEHEYQVDVAGEQVSVNGKPVRNPPDAHQPERTFSAEDRYRPKRGSYSGQRRKCVYGDHRKPVFQHSG